MSGPAPSSSRRSSPLRFRHSSIVILLGAWLALSCGGNQERIDPSGLGPDEVAVLATEPVTGALGLTSPFSLLFSQAVTPLGTERGAYAEDPAVELTPDAPGVWRWSESNKLEFIPDEPFLPNRTYTVLVDGRIGEPRGLVLRGERRFRFVSEPFAVVDTRFFREPIAGRPGWYEVKGTISFNYPVEPEDFASAFSLEMPGSGSIDFLVETEGPSENLSFRSGPIERGDRDRALHIRLEDALGPPVGDATLGRELTRDLTIPARERLVIESARFEVAGDRNCIRVSFSAPVSVGALERSLDVTPPVEGFRVEPRGSDANLFGDWEFGKSYEIRVSPDLVSETGIALEREFKGSVLIGDLPPSLEIAGEGSVLSLRGDRRAAIRTVNVDRINVEIDRIYANNLVHFFHRTGFGSGAGRFWGDLSEYGTNLYRSDVKVEKPRVNETVVTPLALGEFLRPEEQGIFRLSVRDASLRRLVDSRFVLVTDIGLVAKRSEAGILVSAVSIERLEPIPSVEIVIRSRNDQILSTGRTDSDGSVLFSDIGSDVYGDEPFLVTAAKGDDRSFLLFRDTRIPMGDFDVGGVDPLTRGYEAFLYTDRGIYRPGDLARIAWIVRDRRRLPPESFPLTLRVSAPDGKVFHEMRVISGEDGFAERDLIIPEWAATGVYPVALQIDERTVIGRADLQVEDFMPDRMKVDVSLLVDGAEGERAGPDDRIEVVTRAMTLFGPPAANRRSEARLRLFPETVAFADWSGFHFGDPPTDPSLPEKSLGEKKTDETGTARWEVRPPELGDYHGWVRAEVTVEVTELGGGRAVGGRRSVVLSPVAHLVGLRRIEQTERSDYAEPGAPIPFEAVLVDDEGRPVAAPDARLRVYQVRWRSTLRRDPEGRYRYVSERDEELEAERSLSIEAGPTRFEVTVPRHGSYRLVVESDDKKARASIPFYVYGWGYSPWAMSNPEKVKLKLDRETYRPGDEVRAEIEAPFAGLLLLTLERDRVLHHEWVRLDSNSAVVTIRLPDDAEPNAFLTALLLRPLGSLEVHAPARAYGAVPVVMDRGPSRFGVEIDAPETMRPGRDLVLSFRLDGLPAGSRGWATVAAVDEGVLQITDFETPSPLDYFFRRRRLAVESHDIWSLLLPEYETVLRASAPSGGAARRKNLSPISVRRVKPVALWSGRIEAGNEWREVRLPVPEFNGALRLMVVAAGDDRFGSADALVRVRDPIVLTPNLPRFLAPGDEAVVPVQVYNGVTESSGEEIPVTVRLDVEGPIAKEGGAARISLAGRTERVVPFPIRATGEIGKARVTFTGEGGGERTSTSVEMAVRPPWPLASDVKRGVVRPGEPAEMVLPDRWYAGTGGATITVSGLPIGGFAAALPYLLHYPYGCTEQIVSRAFPLLYFADLAREIAPGAFADGGADYYVNSAIDRLAALWVPGRGFAYWPGRGSVPSNPWSTVYATHFLVEASLESYVVPPGLLSGALDVVADVARTSDSPWFRSWERWERLSARAYAVYVLARADRPERGATAYLVQNESGKMTNASRAHLAGAVALSGNRILMESLLPAGPTPAEAVRSTGRTWWSETRDDAIRLEVLATVDPENVQVPVLLGRLADRAVGGRWSNTQENAFALVALGKLAQQAVTEFATGDVFVGDEKVASFGGEDDVVVRGEGWDGRAVRIVAEGPGVAYFTILSEGVPREGKEAPVRSGIVAERFYLDAAGRPVDLAAIPQGDVIICRLTLRSDRGSIQNVVVADLVPAGLEIENPRLEERQAFDWMKTDTPIHVDYLDIRDDRLLLFTDADEKTREFYYSLRAVTVGSFRLPPVKAEAMYDPAVRCISGGGEVRVAAP